MKKVKMAIIAIGLLICTNLPAKQAKASFGNWYVSFHSLRHWVCTPGGGVCCPGIDC